MLNPLIKVLLHPNGKSILIAIKLLLFEIFNQLLNLFSIQSSEKQSLIDRLNQAVREPLSNAIEYLTDFLLII